MESDVVIAVMGLTGVGKSTFIKNLTGNPDIVIGHGLMSETNQVKGYSFNHGNTKYTLVDTPGFNDTFESDDTVAKLLLEWLESSYSAGVRLNGIIYLHSIAFPKLHGSALDNLIMFRKLCGNDAFSRIILATTFWSEVEKGIGEQREKELKQNKLYWGRMIQGGSKVKRLTNTKASALSTLEELGQGTKITLQAQDEMAVKGIAPDQTEAARFMHSGQRSHLPDWQTRHIQNQREAARRRAERLREAQEELERQDKRLKELNDEKEKVRSSQKRTFGTHKCRCHLSTRERSRCSTCGLLIGRAFHHCCFCSTKRLIFLQCDSCGQNCPKPDHPDMKRQEAYCIVM
ncbi:hypothetical protein EJ04DRAFT_546684 [Polyplosphaeria fusca]|uniref:G domain-containing protein n=1 Tax=Polyplosphaeria fusca TaxID=682080 RepID=A0A9P4QNL1_9PLEO|nr:hypothetical protein EJ04DRAFT_546684 [Polyplosphaeria fusca]